MSTEPDVARVAAAFNAPGLRYRSFGNKPVRNDAPRRDLDSQAAETLLRSPAAATRLVDGAAALPSLGVKQFAAAPPPIASPPIAPAPIAPVPVAPVHVVMAPPPPVPPAVPAVPMAVPLSAVSLPPASPPGWPDVQPAQAMPAEPAAEPEFSLLASINAALEAPAAPSRPVADGTLARLRRQVAERPAPGPAGALMPAVTSPLGEVMRSMAEATPPAASSNDIFGAAPRSSSPF